MCFSLGATVAMAGIGAAATAITLRRREPPAIPATLPWFTLMEVLQVAGHLVVDRCAEPLNQTIALLSYLHIVFQPFFVNAFAMELAPQAVRARMRGAVFLCCGISAAVMLLQLWPFEWAGHCRAGAALCGSPLCTVSGESHIGWAIPGNDVLAAVGLSSWLGSGFPTYVMTVFLMPLAYGPSRFVLFHALVGPILAWRLTASPQEAPAIWCLFSIGIVLIALSPWIRRRFEAGQGWPWKASGQAP